jgi:hypothetical protein
MGKRARKDIGLARMLVVAMGLAMMPLSPATAEVQWLPDSASEVDQATTDKVLAMFRRADEALRTRDVEGVMSLYSEQYNYHGLKKSDMRKIWNNLFDEFQELSNVHRLSRFAKVGSGSGTIVEVTCTGSLSGLSKTGGLLVPIDSWYEEVHNLIFENGQWRIRGNVDEEPRIMPFGTSPHPLF